MPHFVMEFFILRRCGDAEINNMALDPTKVCRDERLLYPPFLHAVKMALVKAEAEESIKAFIYEGYRCPERQELLYGHGRTDDNLIVTWAKPFESMHQYGLAVDIVFDGQEKEGIQWNWNSDFLKHSYNDLAIFFKEEGLKWLGDKKIEKAHFEYKTPFDTKALKALWDKRGNLFEVWQTLDKLLEKGK